MQMTGLFYIILAVIADVIANVCLKKSNGFASKKYGFASLALIGVAFLLMAQALVTLDLSITTPSLLYQSSCPQSLSFGGFFYNFHIKF